MWRELLGLLYPRLCIGCNSHLLQQETHLCTSCLYQLPRTHFHLQKDNPLEKTFWGRIPIEQGFAFLYFKKAGLAQRILHQLKYRGNKELAEYIGKVYAGEVDTFIKPDAIIAVPLHPSKERKRGYNQSAWFAKGLTAVWEIPDLSKNIVKVTATATQTKKSRFERWQNVKEVFAVKDADVFANKHILICDDVITTGATIEALVKILPESCKVSICAIAVPVR